MFEPWQSFGLLKKIRPANAKSWPTLISAIKCFVVICKHDLSIQQIHSRYS